MLKHKPATRRDAADHVRLKAAGEPAHINLDEARLLERLMPEAAGPVVTKGLLAEAGRRGDTAVTKLIPAERAALKARGGAGTRNPATGMLEYWGGDNDGGMSGGEGSDSVGNGGMSGDSKAGDTMGGGYGGNDPSYSVFSKPSIANVSLAQLQEVAKQINDDIDSNYGGMYGTGFTQRKDGWSSPDSGWRAIQEMWNGPAYNAPGRFGAPNNIGPGVVGTVAGMFGGGLLGGMMRGGAALGRAQSQQARDDTAASFSDMNSVNSPGQDKPSGAASAASGAASGASTASLPAQQQVPPPGYTYNVAGQLIPLPGGNRGSARADPVRDLLMDYIWRGRQGTGFGW
jgi:hypothetical protein